MTPAQLVAAKQRQAAEAQAIGARFARELEKVLRALERRLSLLIPQVQERSRTATVQAAQLAQMRQELRDALTAAGYDRLAERAASEALDAFTVDLLSTGLGKRVANLVGGALETKIRGLQAMAGMDLLDEGDQVARTLWRTLSRAVFGDTPTDSVLEQLADTLDKALPNVRTLYDTTVSIYGRQVESAMAGADPRQAFVYLGPVDGKMREFCSQHVGKVYTREQIDAMDNGQLPDAFLTGGGYNCRHMWTAVAVLDEDVTHLVGTGQRLPEVQDAMTRVVVKAKAA